MDARENRRAVRDEAIGEERAQLRPQSWGSYEPGSYYLRYRQHGKRAWEWVGNDLTIALQEKKARQKASEAPAVPVSVAALPKRNLRDAVAEFLNGKENRNWCHTLKAFGDWWGWDKRVEDFQRLDFKAFAKHVANLSRRPRTQDNYLRNVCTFFRAAGRVVEIVRNEQDATVAASAQLGSQLSVVRPPRRYNLSSRGVEHRLDLPRQAYLLATFA